MRRRKTAKAMCARCEVTVVERKLQARSGEEFGMWGGLTARERLALLAGRVVDDRVLARLDGIRLRQYNDSNTPKGLTDGRDDAGAGKAKVQHCHATQHAS